MAGGRVRGVAVRQKKEPAGTDAAAPRRPPARISPRFLPKPAARQRSTPRKHTPTTRSQARHATTTAVQPAAPA